MTQIIIISGCVTGDHDINYAVIIDIATDRGGIDVDIRTSLIHKLSLMKRYG